MRSRRWLLLSVLVAVVAAACGNGSNGETTTTEGASPDESFRIVTYNAGLARGFVDYADERAPEVFDAVAGLPVDVVAVQEVWTPEDVAALEDATAEVFPNTFFLDPMPDDVDGASADEAGRAGVGACPLDEAQPLEECARANCGDATDDGLVDCVLQSCGAEYTATCPECQACLAANIGKSLDEILVACTQGGGGGAYAYGGAFGIGILSAEPFVEQDSVVLEASLTRRAVIYVQIDDPVLGPVHIFDTHLTANLDLGDAPVPYPDESGSWSQEQAEQITAARAWIDEKVGDDEVTVFLGDMNNSPEGERYSAETPENYEELVEGEWVDAYVDDQEAECTFCHANLLVGVDDGDPGPMLDHILVRGFGGDIVVVRILDETIEIDRDGERVVTELSDHYGLEATLTR